MNKKLTKREKVLLYILVCFLILVGGIFWLILPSMKTLMDRQVRYQEVQEEYMTTRAAIGGIAKTQEQIGALQEQIAGMEGYYYAPMTSEQVDTLLTGLIRSHNLQPVSMAIGEAEPTALPAFGEKKSGTAAGALLVCEVNAQVVGDKAAAIALADDAAEMTSLRVTGFQSMASHGDAGGTASYTLTFQVYMMLPLEEAGDAAK